MSTMAASSPRVAQQQQQQPFSGYGQQLGSSSQYPQQQQQYSQQQQQGGLGMREGYPPAAARGARVDQQDSGAMKAFYVIASILLPPLAVAVKTGDPCECLINVAWWILGCVPAARYDARDAR